ncbi:hypothetical protein, partial [uncultured Lamprocystis sp.]
GLDLAGLMIKADEDPARSVTAVRWFNARQFPGFQVAGGLSVASLRMPLSGEAVLPRAAYMPRSWAS